MRRWMGLGVVALVCAHVAAWSAVGQQPVRESAGGEPTMPPITLTGATSGGAEAAIVADESLYVAGSRWNRTDGKSLWLWRLDRSGTQQWSLTLDTQQRTEGVSVVGLLPDTRKLQHGAPRPGVRAITRRGLETSVTFVSDTGETLDVRELGTLEDTYGVVAVGDGDLLLFGSSMIVHGQPRHAWVARVTRLGAILWKRTFPFRNHESPNPDGSEGESTPGMIRLAALYDAVPREDGTVVLAGQYGRYNKFGAGPSTLVLLHLDGDGRQIGMAPIAGGRLFPASRGVIGSSEEGVVVAYSTGQLGDPPNRRATGEIGFPLMMACFDDRLEPVWEREVTNAYLPGAASLLSGSPVTIAATDTNGLQLLGIGSGGAEVWRDEQTTVDATVLPVTLLRDEGGVVAVFNRRQTNEDLVQLQIVRRVQP